MTKYDSEIFGVLLSQVGYYDDETGFYYLGSRYYDPETGRFINADGTVNTGQGILGNNMYAYCLNNPVNMSDEGGGAAMPLMPPGGGDIAALITSSLHINVLNGRVVTSWDHEAAPQSRLGYNVGFDLLSRTIFCITTIAFKFKANDKDWMIQLWKGLYTSASFGGEIGIYNGRVLSIPGW